MKKWILLLVLIAGGYAAWRYTHPSAAKSVEYITAPLTRGDIIQAVTATGTLNPVINVQVGSQISGNIQKLYADYNSEVKAGQIVAQLDPAVYQAVVHQMEGELASSKAALELARLTADRKRELVSQKAAAPADLDAAVATLHQAEAMVQVRQANLEKAKVDLDRCTIYSPIDGVVISRAVDVGQTVAATLNAPIIFTVANDLTKMQIDSNVAEADVGNTEVGQDVEFTVDAFPYRTFTGKVAQVRNAAVTVQNVVTYDVVISVQNEDMKLKPGMTANVSIVIAHREGALRLPNSALRFRLPDTAAGGGKPGGKPGAGARTGSRSGSGAGRTERRVYVLDGSGAPQPVPVKLGITDGITTELLEGLKESDKVVIGADTGAAPAAPARSGSPLTGGPPRFR